MERVIIVTREVINNIPCDKTLFVPHYIFDAINYWLWGIAPILFCAGLTIFAIIVTIKEIKGQRIKELERKIKKLEKK